MCVYVCVSFKSLVSKINIFLNIKHDPKFVKILKPVKTKLGGGKKVPCP